MRALFQEEDEEELLADSEDTLTSEEAGATKLRMTLGWGIKIYEDNFLGKPNGLFDSEK